MADTKRLDQPPPRPVGPIDAAVALRASNEDGDSACFVLGNELVLTVLDVRSERPLRHGAYIKSCTITADNTSTEYRCPDEHRYPRAARNLDEYKGNAAAEAWQKDRFYRYVGSSLKRLGYYKGNGWPRTYELLKQPMIDFYAAVTGGAAKQSVETNTIDINTVVSEIDVLIERELGGRDHVPPDGSGEIRIGLPDFVESGSVKVRLEFHDIKFITSEDMDSVKHLEGGAHVPGLVRPSRVGGIVVYDRAAATWPSSGVDPDIAQHESTREFSNWYLHCGQPPIHPINQSPNDRVLFRNFVEFTVPVNPEGGTSARRTIYAMTWAPPVWHESESFKREGFAFNSRNFVGPPILRAGPASNSLHVNNGSSRENYSIFGIFRTSDGYQRLHTGIDLTGYYYENGGKQKTPVFALNGGLYINNYPTIHHADLAISRYVHIFPQDRLLQTGQWAKAGTLVGRMGRSGITSQWPTHVHFETLAYINTGWAGPADASRWSELSDGAAKISAASYPHDQAIHVPRTDGKPQYVKYQYGTWVRDPGTSVHSWLEKQLGASAWLHYRDDMPASYPAYQMPPCKCEFGTGHTNNPSSCTASCLKPDGSADANQLKWAQNCWAIRSSKQGSRCVCPGVSSRGIAASFTKNQRIQYHLWQLGRLDGKFDGGLGQGTRNSIESALPDLGENSTFASSVAAKAKELSKKQNPTKEAITALLKEAAHVDQLLTELEAVANARFGT